MEYSVSAFNGECKRMFDISLPRIDAQGLKLLVSLANMKHCYKFPFGNNNKQNNKNVSPGEMKAVTSTVDGIIFAS